MVLAEVDTYRILSYLFIKIGSQTISKEYLQV